MAISEAQKKAAKKWDSENMVTIGTRIKKDEAEAFRSYCAAAGISPNACLREYIRSCISSNT